MQGGSKQDRACLGPGFCSVRRGLQPNAQNLASLYLPDTKPIFPKSLMETWLGLCPLGEEKAEPSVREEESEAAEPCASALGSWPAPKTPSWPSFSFLIS